VICSSLITNQPWRVTKKRNGSVVEGFLFSDDLKRIGWLDGTGTLKAQFVFAKHPHVPDYFVAAGVAYRLVVDRVGSVRLVVASDGTVVERIDYDEFGQVLADSAPGVQPFGFAGGLKDVDTGLIRFGSRDYDPALGRWTARDPIDFSGGQPNLYVYAGNDPINFFDPEGLYAEVGVRKFYPVPVPYARHCFVRFNGDNNDTLSFSDKGVGPDANPQGADYSPTIGPDNDDCVRMQMMTCKASDYAFCDFNCCKCVSNALYYCGLKKRGPWPNKPCDANNPPYLPPK